MNIRELSFNTNITSLGAILGTSGSQSLIANINEQCGGGSFFGNQERDPFSTGYYNFMQQVVEPIRETQHRLEMISAQVSNPDVYRAITTAEDLRKGIPPCMQLGIIYYAPVRRMLEEERIDGFGIDPKTLEKDDPYEDMIKSGKWEGNSLDIQGEWAGVTFYEKSTDPDLTFEEIRCLEATRKFLDKFMTDEDTKHYDPTLATELHG